MKNLEHSTNPVFGGLQNFFFAEQSPYGAALVRICLIFSAMIPMTLRFPWLRELYTTDGAPQSLIEMYGQANPFPPLPPQIAAAFYGLMLFSMACAIIGWNTRLSLIVGTPLYIYFNLLDSVGTMTKYSVIASHLLVLLAFSSCGEVWSVDAIIRRSKSGASSVAPPVFPVWPVRLMQLLFCFIYFGAAVTKIQTESFFSGEQMRYWMLSNWNYENPIGEIMSMSTPLLLASAYITVVWEILFGFLVFRPGTRLIMLGVGVAFHLMTNIALGLYIFPAICISGYLCFVSERDVVIIRRFLRNVRIPTVWVGWPFRTAARLVEMRPASMPMITLWSTTLVLAALGATELEYRLDHYGLLADGGPMPLQPMDRELALSMINNPKPVREKDKYFSFDIGTTMVGGQLANRRTEFAYGENIIAQCNLNPPHEDLWVECLLQDEEERIIEQSGRFVTREMMYETFSYATGNSLVPGNYSMVLRSSGRDIFRRRFRLTGDAAVIPEMGEINTN